MIDKMVLETIEKARGLRVEREKQASEKVEEEERQRSPTAFVLRKLARQVSEATLSDQPEEQPPEHSTKTAEDAETALKGLTLLRRFAGGTYANAV
jgi:hypothetical protein